jgi:hypothetical protein
MLRFGVTGQQNDGRAMEYHAAAEMKAKLYPIHDRHLPVGNDYMRTMCNK